MPQYADMIMMLEARERRAYRQQELLEQYHLPLISFSGLRGAVSAPRGGCSRSFGKCSEKQPFRNGGLKNLPERWIEKPSGTVD